MILGITKSMAKLRCPSCRNTFPWSTAEGWPRFCPLCSYDTSMDDNPEVAMPHVSDGRAKNMLKSAEQTYRGYETATANNAKTAAELAGVPESDMADLKITNMNTQLRPGDLAVTPPSNDVTRFMEQNRQVVEGLNANAQGYAAMAHQGGSDAFAGARALGNLREIHATTGQQRVVAGQTGVKGQGPGVQPMSSEIPALEVHNKVLRSGGKRTF